MTDDRYEIRSKIGEGGVGAVYRAFDKHLNREVAIKRVLAGGEGEDRDDATDSMLKEAAALSSLQHPHIVTVYDSGEDKDGPYVVMELLSGRTINEMVDRGILTYEDFREVALQSQEALIAAQDLDLVHRDIKPTNLMITWLPSGRFHTKLVDFGLAKFQPMPSHQTVDHGDAVFGSIRFMAPEQFERTPLDKRTDMYSMGCVYYYCLTGRYPFDGETAPQVMTAHLQHNVIHLSQLRPDLPTWLCDWVMWHMSRNMDDRPVDTRNSLTHFLMGENNASNHTQPVPMTSEEIAAQVERLSPDSPAASPLGTNTAPQPIVPPEGHSPSVHTAAQSVQANNPAPAPQARLVIPGAAPAAASAPASQPLATPPVQGNTTGVQATAPAASTTPEPQVTVPLAGRSNAETPAPAANPLLVTGSTAPAAAPLATPAAPASPLATAVPASPAPGTPPLGAPGAPAQGQAEEGVTIGTFASAKKPGISNPVKMVIAAALLVLIVIAALVYKGDSDNNDRIARLNELKAYFKDPTNPPTEIPMTGDDVSIVLNDLLSTEEQDAMERESYFRMLRIAKATDGTDVNLEVATFAKDTKMQEGIRQKLFMVVERRGEASALPALIAYASGTEDTNSGTAALKAASQMATSSNFQDLLAIISNSTNGTIKSEAVKVLSAVIASSDDQASFAPSILSAYNSVVDDSSRGALLRLAGSTGTDKVADLVTENLESDNETLKTAAIFALQNWPNDEQFEVFLDFTKKQTTERLRRQAFESIVVFLKECKGIDQEDISLYWSDVAAIATGTFEQISVIGAMNEQSEVWADDILDYFIENADDDRVLARAEDTKERLAEKRKRNERSGNNEEEGDE